MAKKRITELATETTLKDGQYVAIDHTTDGTKKYNIGAELTDLKEDFEQVETDITTLYDMGTPASYNNDKVPYLFRPSGGGKYIGGIEKDTIVGGTVAWNQRINAFTPRTEQNKGLTITYTTNSITINGTATDRGNFQLSTVGKNNGTLLSNHIYYMRVCPSGGSGSTYYGGIAGLDIDIGTGGIYKHTYSWESSSLRFDFFQDAVFNNATFYPQYIDLTQLFGSTIADYIYSLEQANAGSGIAKLKSWGFFADSYYPYDSGSLKSVEGLSAHVMRDADENIIGNYPLDSALTLRGIPKLDSSNQLYYDGDIYKADGSVTRKYGTRAYQSGDESLTDAITDGTNTVYKLSTPTTETTDPYQTPQLVDKYGTEEYVTTGIVPVGHDTDYYLDADSVLTPPSTAGTYSLKVTVASDGSKSYSWVSD